MIISLPFCCSSPQNQVPKQAMDTVSGFPWTDVGCIRGQSDVGTDNANKLCESRSAPLTYRHVDVALVIPALDIMLRHSVARGRPLTFRRVHNTSPAPRLSLSTPA